LKNIIFFDIETDPATGKVLDYGAVSSGGGQLHTKKRAEFGTFLRGASFICGHNIFDHDLKYIGALIRSLNKTCSYIDTLRLSPLLFPKRPYHRLLKDDKLQSGELNNPFNDSCKARDLFYDEVNAFNQLPADLQHVFRGLLGNIAEFSGFFDYLEIECTEHVEALIRSVFLGRICDNADLKSMIQNTPTELAYTLALINADDNTSLTPPWVIRNFPYMMNVMSLLRSRPCGQSCSYCGRKLDARIRLKDIFGFDNFRTFDGEPLQERAVRAAVEEQSLLAVFPTGGGKSLTFQLPALIAGDTSHGLTIVISPLQSLMKDQVDNLEERGIVEAVAINGLLDPIERKSAIDRVANGMASILYISPESLRSRTIEELLYSRNVVRFVIDEAHCFSAWGQDFRVDYMYIGDFIRRLQERKRIDHPIPVSCFTATAKQRVITDICDYFRRKLGLELRLFATKASRTNLRYVVMYKDGSEEKYLETRRLIQSRDCPAIIYVSRVRRTVEIAERLVSDGFSARPYNGKMSSEEKVSIQNAFTAGDVRIIVATSAFGMGVDKKDVGLVIHFDISDSLENYIQEAGRAGRDESIEAECFVLFNDDDLDRHFVLLNQTKLSLSEIQQIWKAVRSMTKTRDSISCSALELARAAGWDDSVSDIETRVRTAISALEQAGFLVRGLNAPHIYANSLRVTTMAEAAELIDASPRFSPEQKMTAKRTVKFLISRHSISGAGNADAESRVDYIADRLGVPKEDVIDAVNLMREDDILADHTDLTAVMLRLDSENRSMVTLRRFLQLEDFLIDHLESGNYINYKELNERALREGVVGATVKDLRTLIFYWTITGLLRKPVASDSEITCLERTMPPAAQRKEFEKRAELASFIIDYLFRKTGSSVAGQSGKRERSVPFSILELLNAYREQSMIAGQDGIGSEDIKKALLYLSKIRSMTLEGGFLVSYNAMQLRRLKTDNHVRFGREDYRQLDEFYRQRIQQIHIVGEYAHLMVRDYEAALQFVSDYFLIDYSSFIAKYFSGRRRELHRNITSGKYEKLFGGLSEIQRKIIDDDRSRHIVVAAGPGSGKTMLLVHKLASLLTMEDVKHEQLLMLTFSRAAATEFKKRLMELIGSVAHYVEIKTFHSFCFDLLGRIGTLEQSTDVVRDAVDAIMRGDVEPGRVTRTVLVLDEAQDMSENEFALIRALIKRNDGLRVIAVGDDDQNIFAFRGSDSGYMQSLVSEYGAKLYQMTDNYRSCKTITWLANAFAATISSRMKTEPIRAVSDRLGKVTVVTSHSPHLELPLTAILKTELSSGSRCVLTASNEEAFRVTGLLRKEKIPAKLIQSMDGFDLNDLAELRAFLEYLGESGLSPSIDSKQWDNAVDALRSRYAESTALPLCLNLLETFSSLNRTKFRSDLVEFIQESKPEDFFDSGGDSILVSTMHKAKGRQFDNVYLMLDHYDFSSDEKKRAVYVALTRAKNVLHICTNTLFFDRFRIPGIEFRTDHAIYPEPPEIMLELGHRDVVLSYFKDKQRIIPSLLSGQKLIPDGLYLRTAGSPAVRVVRLSKNCCTKLQTLFEKGYRIDSAAIRFVVWWRDKDDDNEISIILPDLCLKKENAESLRDTSVDDPLPPAL